MRATALTTVRQRNRSSRTAGATSWPPISSCLISLSEPLAPRMADQPQGARASGWTTAATAVSSTGPQPARSALTAPAGPIVSVSVASAWTRSRRRVSSLAPGSAASSEQNPARSPDMNTLLGRSSRCARPARCRRRSDANNDVAPGTLTASPSAWPAGTVVTSTSVSPGISASSSIAGLGTLACCARQEAKATCSIWTRVLSATRPATDRRKRASAHNCRSSPDPRVSRPDRCTRTRVPSVSAPSSRARLDPVTDRLAAGTPWAASQPASSAVPGRTEAAPSSQRTAHPTSSPPNAAMTTAKGVSVPTASPDSSSAAPAHGHHRDQCERRDRSVPTTNATNAVSTTNVAGLLPCRIACCSAACSARQTADATMAVAAPARPAVAAFRTSRQWLLRASTTRAATARAKQATPAPTAAA